MTTGWRALAALGLLLTPVACGPGTPDRSPDGGSRDPVRDEPGDHHDGDGGVAAGAGCALPGEPPPRQVLFTRSLPNGDLTIENELVHLVEGAKPGALLRAAFGYLDRGRVADALVDAAARGVDVRLVLDERNQVDGADWNQAVTSLRDALGQAVVICGGADVPADESGGCIGSAKMHASFLLVSSTCDGAQDVVAQTSAYPTKRQLEQRDDLVIVRGDHALFDAYDAYWDDLAAQQRDPDYYRFVDGDEATRLFLYPRAADGKGGEPAATDTVYRLLHDHVDCGAGARVKVAPSYWTSTRGALVDELSRLQQAGCVVDVVVDPARVDAEVEAALVDAFAPDHLRLLPRLHHKVLIIEGRYAGEDRRLVWTGTQDFTLTALRDNDETILRLEDDDVVDEYVATFAQLFAEGASAVEAP